MLSRLPNLCRCIAIGLLAVSPAAAHYFYTQFATNGPYSPIVQKFDVSSLPNSTIPFYISSTGPSKLASGDSFLALISEIQAAANIWNSIPSATLKLQYGGLYQPGTASSGPGIFIEFSDSIPAGLLAVSQPIDLQSLKTAGDGSQFYPINQSRMQLPLDMSQLPSYSEIVFTTLVHEFGHTMGLQHTITSSVMSTSMTSGSTRANPLATDDIAGFSWLYPTPDFANQTGSISGTVTDMNGNGIHLASVAAIAPGLDAVSAFTNPDGTFIIHGIPPGTYSLYVQPLPPAAQGQTTEDGIIYPVARDGKTVIQPGPYFAGQFYPGSQSPAAAAPVQVVAGITQDGIRFRVQTKDSPAVYSVRTYGFVPNGIAVPSPPIVIGTTLAVEAAGVGLITGSNTLTPGLAVGPLGSLAQIVPGSLSVYPPPNDAGFVYASLAINAQATSGTGHLFFSTPGDVYVLPAAFHTVSAPPPQITAISTFTSRIVAIRGQSLTKDTAIYFDGVPATQLAFTPAGQLIVSVPDAPGGYQANVVALNPDGQSSLFLGPPAVYTYNSSLAESLRVKPSVIPANATTTVEVEGMNTDFLAGRTIVGFGSSDIQAQSMAVDSPTHMLITVVNNSSSSVQTAQAINITNGLDVLSQATGANIELQ